MGFGTEACAMRALDTRLGILQPSVDIHQIYRQIDYNQPRIATTA